MRYIVGVDVGGTNLVVGTVPEDGSALYGLETEPTDVPGGPDAAVRQIERLVTASLSETRSELALPLRSGGQILGAMTVQSEQAAFFSEQDISVMQTVADQVANAVRNASLFQQVQESLAAERRAYGQLTQEAWRTLLQARAGPVVRSSQAPSPVLFFS